MAKLATQTLIIELSKAVPNSSGDELKVISEEHLDVIHAALQEVLELPDGVVIDVTEAT